MEGSNVISIVTVDEIAGAQYGGDFTVSEERQEVIFTFTANDVLTRIVLDLEATADAVYFIDDVSVLEPPQ